MFCVITIVATLILSSFSHCVYSTDLLEKQVIGFQEELSKIGPTLKGSIISVESEKYNFSYLSSGVIDQSQFYIGSVSKQMTAFMFLNALQKQHPMEDLSELLQLKLVEALPHSGLLKHIDKTWVKEVTLFDLLTHRSGLSDYVGVYEHEFKQPEALNETIDSIKILQSVTFDPLKKYQYSNTNYFLLGKLIEEMEKCGFDEIFDSMIKKPAEMTVSFAPIKGNYHDFKRQDNFVRLLPDLNSKIFIDMGNAIGTGNVISSSSDLLKWNRYLHSKISPKLREIILKKYFQDDDEDWVNIGLSTTDTNKGSLIGFQGGQDSYHSFVGYFPEHNLNVVILSNNSDDFEKLIEAFQKFIQSKNESVKISELDIGKRLLFKFNKSAQSLVALNIDQCADKLPVRGKSQTYFQKMKSMTFRGNWEM